MTMFGSLEPRTGINTAIVVEGGAMRGIFAAGVLDGLLDLGLTDFDLAIGTSAGACNLASFLARQRERNLRCYVNIMARPGLFSLRRALRGGHYMDLDALWDAFAREEPLDEQAIASSRTQLVAVNTCARTARPVYLAAEHPGIHEFLKAGCALPLLYRGPVALRGESVVDGGLVDPIPAREAYRRGARRLLVIRSRPASVVKHKSPLDAVLARLLFREGPAVARAARETPQRYQEAVAFLKNPPADAQLVEIAPELPLATSRTSQNIDNLRKDYALGRALAVRYEPRIRALLDVEALGSASEPSEEPWSRHKASSEQRSEAS
jgi:predicted patatin/cPLA2 family phospholipase